MNAVDAAVYSKLTGDTTLKNMLSATTAIYRHVAPPGVACPYVVFGKQAGSDDYTFGARVASSMPYLVKAVDDGLSGKDANTIADRIDALMTDGALSVSGKTLLYCRRETHVDYTEHAAAGVIYQHVGGVFRIEVA